MTEVRNSDGMAIPAKIILRTWPKMLFLWPTALAALIAGLGMALLADAPERGELWGTLFLVIFTLNLVVVTFEFPRSTSLTLVLALVALTWIFVELNRRYGIIAPLRDFTEALQLIAMPDFYFAVCVIYLLLLIGMFISTRFSYWEITNNEMVHHRGLMQDVERFSTDGLQYTKQITDFFEYVIGRSGRLIMRTPAVDETIVLDNIIGINQVAHTLDRLLEARRVVVSGVSAPPPAPAPIENQA
jgi:Ca2+/Na+ antiporter